MTEATGLQWPLDAKGKRGSGAPGQRIVAAAFRGLGGLDGTAADAVVAERDWRHAYPPHWRALVQAQAARPVHTANHGGLWRLPYLPRSVLPMAALLGFVKRR